MFDSPFPLSPWLNRLKWSSHKCLVLSFSRVSELIKMFYKWYISNICFFFGFDLIPVGCSKSLKLVSILNIPVRQLLHISLLDQIEISEKSRHKFLAHFDSQTTFNSSQIFLIDPKQDWTLNTPNNTRWSPWQLEASAVSELPPPPHPWSLASPPACIWSSRP